MTPNHTRHRLRTGGASRVAKFGLSTDDSAHIMTILRDTLYTDRILAVLREYASNAWDAHREAGKPDLPIEVKLPTFDEPVLAIRDWGPGLSPDDIVNVYTKYGASTKRSNNDVTGLLGIGSKAAFAYATSFTITSWHGGKKRVYTAALDPSNCGVVDRLHESACDSTETGVEIRIPVEPSDCSDFKDRARALFAHFTPRPIINVEIPEVASVAMLNNGTICPEGALSYNPGTWVAVMGCVPYRLNIGQLGLQSEPSGMASVFKLSGVLRFDIGEVEIVASREELKYTDKTTQALVAKLTALVDEYVQHALALIDQDSTSAWDRRLRIRELDDWDLPVPSEHKDLTQSHATLVAPRAPDGAPTIKFRARSHSSKSATGVAVHSATRVVLVDDTRCLSGFVLERHDCVIKLFGSRAKKDLRATLDELLASSKLTGVPVVQSSTLPWSPPRQRGGRASTAQGASKRYAAKLRLFRYIGVDDEVMQTRGSSDSAPSTQWEPVDRTPTDDDVFVRLKAFRPMDLSMSVFMQQWHAAKSVMELLGRSMPEVYGYRVTATQPEATTYGMEFTKWRNEIRAEAQALPEFKTALIRYQQGQAVYDEARTTANLETLRKSLPGDHLLIAYVQTVLDAHVYNETSEGRRWETHIHKLVDYHERHARTEILDAILKAYPLLRIQSHTTWVNDGLDEAWIEYIQLIDAARRTASEAATNSPKFPASSNGVNHSLGVKTHALDSLHDHV